MSIDTAPHPAAASDPGTIEIAVGPMGRAAGFAVQRLADTSVRVLFHLSGVRN